MHTVPTERVAEEVRSIMARRRITGAELARRMDRPQSNVARRLTGEIAWDVNDLSLVAEALEVDIRDLVEPLRSRA